MRSRLASLTTSETSSAEAGQHRHVRHELGPAMDRERRRHARAVDARAEAGQHAVVVADDRPQLVDHALVDGALVGDAHCIPSAAAAGPRVVPPTSIPADSATSSNRSADLERPVPRLRQRPLGPRAGAHERVDLEPLGALDAPAADLGRDLRLLDRQPATAARAVRPLRHVVDVLEGEAGDGAQQLARRLVDALALVEPAGVVVGDGALNRPGELEPAVAHELGDQLDAEHDLEVIVVAEQLGIVLGEGDVVVRVGRQDALRPHRPPVRDVVLGVLAREVDVAHLGSRPAAAPLLAHEAELDARLLQQLRERTAVGGPVEGRLAVDEQDRLAARGQAEPLGPVAHVLLADRHFAEHRLVGPLCEPLVPELPALALVAGRDHQGAHRLHDVDGSGAVAVEVAGEERVRAAQLAGAALRAVDEVVRHVLDGDEPLLHRDDRGVERGGRVVLVAGDLHDRTHLATELVPGREAAVRVVAPLFDELALELAVAVR